MKVLFLLVLPVLFSGCSSKTADEYKQQAEENIKNNKLSEAVSVYEDLINDHPRSDEAKEAFFELALIYQHNKLKELTPLKSQEKAAETFRLFQEKFPRHEKAPLALFMAAYINANELGKYQQATELYNSFLKKYPDHELAVSAQQELDIMGIDPDEVLKNKATIDI
jgi:TolA-binding protein